MGQFTSEWQAWHDDRLAALATPFGFLSITGLHWLEQGENAWEGAPGTFERDGDVIRFRIAPGRSAGPTRAALDTDAAQVAQVTQGAPDSQGAQGAQSAATGTALGTSQDGTLWLRLSHNDALPWIVADHTTYEAINRDGRVGIRIRDSKSDLLAHFVDIPTFPLKPAAVVQGIFRAYPEPRPRRIATALPGLEMDTRTLGEITFELSGETHTLTATGNLETGLTLDFHDRTNGDTTPHWRTLSVGLPDASGYLTIDFNRTVVYPFAFMPWATCPAPVRENILPIAIRAGEKIPSQTLSETGLSHPVGVVAMSDGFPVPEALDWLEESGTQLFRHRVRRGTAVPGPASASAFIVYGMKDQEGHADSETVDAVRAFANDALAVGTPIIGIGTSGAEAVFAAARELRDQDAGSDCARGGGGTADGETGSDGGGGDGGPHDDPLTQNPIPVVVSADVAEDRMLRGCVTMCPVTELGFVDVEALAAEIGDDTESRYRVWTDLIDRFARLVLTRQ